MVKGSMSSLSQTSNNWIINWDKQKVAHGRKMWPQLTQTTSQNSFFFQALRWNVIRVGDKGQEQGWTLALARSPRRVSKVSGECKSQITRPFGECDFSSPRNWLNCKINDVFYILFCREISKHKLTIVHICMAKFYTPNCPKNGRWSATLGFAK